MEKKYIIEIEDKPFELLSEDGFTSEKLFRVKGFNSLVFDWNGLNMLTPYTEPDLERVREEAFEEGKKQAKVQAELDVCHDIEKVAKENYKVGLSDAWEAARKIGNLPEAEKFEIFGEYDMFHIMRRYTASEAIEKIRQYEREKIKAGDEVFCVDCPDIKIWVIDVYDNKFAGIALSDVDGCCDIGDLFKEEPLKNYAKTGNHYEIAAVLEKMRGENND